MTDLTTLSLPKLLGDRSYWQSLAKNGQGNAATLGRSKVRQINKELRRRGEEV